MDPWRHRRAPPPPSLASLSLSLSLSLGPSAELPALLTGSPVPLGLPGVGQYGAERGGSKVEAVLLLPSQEITRGVERVRRQKEKPNFHVAAESGQDV